MKIAVWHNLPSGGGKRALHDHITGLVSRGHEITVFCPEISENEYLPLSSSGVDEVLLPYDSISSPKPNGGLSQALWESRRITAQYRSLDKHCRLVGEEIQRQGDFDVLFANSSTHFYMHPLARYVSIPSVFYLQEPYRFIFEARPNLPWEAIPDPVRSWFSPGYLKWYLDDVISLHGKRVQLRNELANARKYDRILVNSLYSRESVMRSYGIESEVCYLGIDTAKFCPKQVNKENYVIGLGGLYPPKGPERIIQALGCVDKNIRPELEWIGNFGSEDYVKRCKAMASDLDVTFNFRTMVTDEELITALSAAMFMVYAPIMEPFGYAPLEANSCGTPVVAVAEGGVKETIRHGVNGLLSPSASPEIFSQSITQMIKDTHLRSQMASTCRNEVKERWGLDSAITRLENNLLDVVESHNHDD